MGCHRPAYQAHFCASCHLMAEFGGKPASLWMNYDLTFLSVLLSSLEGPGTPRALACTAMPWRRVQVAPLPAWGRHALAALNLALLAAKLEDDRQDEKGFVRKLAGAWVSRYQKRVDAVLGESGFPLELIRRLPERQSEVERLGASLEELSRPTSEVIAAVLEHVGEVRPERKADLRALGAKLGTFLYYLDAAQDFREDARKRRFNALARCWGPEWQEARTAALLQKTLEELSQELRRFADLQPIGGLIDPLLDSLADRLPARTPWRPSWRQAQAAFCDCGSCDCPGGDAGGCDCCCGGSSGGSGCCCPDLSPCSCCHDSGSQVDCCCWSADCCGSDVGTTTSSGATAGKAERTGPLRCPGCHATLKAQMAGKTEVDVCPACAGIWLDKHELKALAKMRSLPGWLLEPVASQPERGAIPEGQRICPHCQMPLQTADSKGVGVDLCRGCEGIWLDRGELNRLLKS